MANSKKKILILLAIITIILVVLIVILVNNNRQGSKPDEAGDEYVLQDNKKLNIVSARNDYYVVKKSIEKF